MNSFYDPTIVLIEKAVAEDKWDEVNKLYQAQPLIKRSELDTVIFKNVLKKISSLPLNDLTEYLLRALTLVPSVLIKQDLYFKLQENSKFSSNLNFLGKSILELSADIFTVMLINKQDYQTALDYVRNGERIPSIANVIN